MNKQAEILRKLIRHYYLLNVAQLANEFDNLNIFNLRKQLE